MSANQNPSHQLAVTRLQHAAETLLGMAKEREAAALARSQRRANNNSSDPSKTAGIQACAACKKAKIKCLPNEGQSCARCMFVGQECVMPEPSRRGPKLLSRTSDALDIVIADVNAALEALQQPGLPAPIPEAGVPVDDADSPGGELLDEAESEVLRNPWSALRVAEDGRRGSTSLGGENTLYSVFAEDASRNDPVILGLLTEHQLDHLLQIYFVHLRPFFWHLEPTLHTAAFLRRHSPFLTTAIAAAAATFDATLAPQAYALLQHAQFLADDAFARGYKSLEVSQAYGFLTHWSSVTETWREDRNWQYHQESMRIASEIRMDLPLSAQVISRYQLPETMTAAYLGTILERTRSRTWTLLCCGDIAISLQSGRLNSVSALHLSGGLRRIIPRDESEHPYAVDDPELDYDSNETLNYLLAKMIYLWNGLQEESAMDDSDLRESFQAAFEPLIVSWETRYPTRSYFIRLLGLNTRIMLTLLALRFKGSEQSTRALLGQSWEIALATVNLVTEWAEQAHVQEALPFASNYVLMNIAYGSILALKLGNVLDLTTSSLLYERCEGVAGILTIISYSRYNARSFAGYYSSKIRLLLAEIMRASATPSGDQIEIEQLDLSTFSLETLETVNDTLQDVMFSFGIEEEGDGAFW